MNKKEFKMHLATNPVFSQWMKENSSWLKSKPEVMMYIVRHPNAMGHFRPGQPVDKERLSRSAEQFTSQMEQERMNRKRGREKTVPSVKVKADQGEGGKGSKVSKLGKGLFSNLKNIFPNMGIPAIPVHATKLPALKPPGIMPPLPRIPMNTSTRAIKGKRKSPFRLPKINISRAKLMETMSQTTEMLDVISALLGKIGSMK